MGPYLSLVAVLLAAGGLLAAATVYVMARALVRPPRMTDGKALYLLRRLTPRDLGLAYEDVAFTVRGGPTGAPLRLAAWWVPAHGGRGASEKTVILVHGYADAKVGAIAWAPAWHDLHFNVLAIDLRAHGESGGDLCTGGYFERDDLAQVAHQLVAREPAATRTLFLFGASLGAAAAVGAAELLTSPSPGEPPEAEGGRPSRVLPLIGGVVLDSPFADFRSAAAAHFARLGLPGGWAAGSALRLAERMAGAAFTAVRPVDLIQRVRCPLLVLAAGDDAYVTPAEAVAIERAVTDRPKSAGPGGYLRFDGVEHMMAVVAAAEEYRAALGAFVSAAVPEAV